MRMRAAAVIAVTVLTAACTNADGNDAAQAENAEDAQIIQPSTDVQIVQVTVRGTEYGFSPARVKAGMPVRLLFDPNGLPGCSRSVTLPDYGITKTIEERDATIEFTPRAEGPIVVACTMNMFTGTLVAE